ncbi:hypothetical protein Tco_0701524 [Tanacetum coccineum]
MRGGRGGCGVSGGRRGLGVGRGETRHKNGDDGSVIGEESKGAALGGGSRRVCGHPKGAHKEPRWGGSGGDEKAEDRALGRCGEGQKGAREKEGVGRG